ncbi:hypothetical protein O1G22_00035 [Streptomyces camelliae]|uniref:Uncharacterized protein n=1 Tax=Streptomyces camelliae TaxID=3004093 RepID=A0ABY7NVQ4_9ACTN|nr:hypothetical protein [Streptomyces sp. HUAS 2-6]WBO61390.1 hypothetical protein O1G22_00035 [Streptomyces sp. HUAS 2-6]
MTVPLVGAADCPATADLGDVPAAAGFDAGPVLGDLGGGLALDRLHHGPAHQLAALFGDVPATDDGVGLVVPRGQPRPRAQPVGGGEAVHVADLSHKYGRQGRADAGQLLDGPVAGVVAKPFRDATVEHGFLSIEFADQLE